MKWKCVVGLIPLFTFSIGCGQTAIVVTDSVNGVKANNATFAIFAEKIELADLDEDGVEDDTRTSLLMIAANNPNICDIITADPNLQNPGNLTTAFGIAIKTDIDNEQGGFIAGEGLSTNDEDFADAGFIVFKNNVAIADTIGELNVDESNNASTTFLVGENLSNERLTADFFNDTMPLDFADEENFDFDADLDGINDSKIINASFIAQVTAEFCPALLDLLE